jgi:uncharacterized damage-inducible protein DinB
MDRYEESDGGAGTALIDELFEAMEWSDAAMWRAVLAFPATESDQKIREIVYHLHLVQRAFFFVWTEQPFAVPEFASFPDNASMARWAHTYYDESLAFRRSVDDLRRPVHLPWQDRILEITGGVPHDATLGDTMLQVALHSTYHRGQVNLRLRQLGSETPMTDFIAWVWLGKPKAQWTV